MIVKSLASQDLYKFSMQQVFMHHAPTATGEYLFKCRNKGIDFAPFLGKIEAELRHVARLRMEPQKIQFLR